MKRLLLSLVALAPLSLAATAQDASDWPAVLAEAQGQTVYWNAWGGDDGINAYIEWVGDEVEARYGVDLVHVKLTDTAAAVQTVETEFAAGRSDDGSIDMIWINGENFARLKRQGFLGEGFSEDLPNYALTDFEDKITIRQDFSESVDGLESPWGLAQFTFLYDSSLMDSFPGDAEALLAWAEANPGRFAYPAPPAFVGTTFLKQLALELVDDPALLYDPAGDDADAVLAPMWAYLENLHEVAWREGKAFPESHVELRDLFNSDEIDALLTFNPGDATALVAQGILPDTIATAGFEAGSIGNTHFVTIPGNSGSRAGAMVVANFLISAEAQALKADPETWGDATVLDLEKLSAEDRALFPESAPVLGASVLEPDSSWVPVLEAGWAARFAN